jgi:hypothetical protein
MRYENCRGLTTVNTAIAKVFRLGALALCIVLNPFITAEVTLGPPVDKASNKYPVVSSLDTDNPICYIQESNGSTLDLSQLCGEQEITTQLSETDQKFLASYNNSLSAYQNMQTLVTPDTEKSPESPIKLAQNVCSALKSQVPLAQIETDQYQRIIETEDPRNQKFALIEAEIIDSLATKFYCPEFAK